MLIGGAVIDRLNNLPIKDWDIEVYGLSLSQIEACLTSLGLPANMVGKSFGVIKTRLVIDGETVEVDLSVPRRDNKIGIGHKGFEVELDPTMTPKEAGQRRDLTINSMYFNLHTEQLVDPFNGLDDLKLGRVKATDPAKFAEDPLRVLRIMQLFPRKMSHGFVEPATMRLCQSLVDSFSELPSERLLEEFNKLLLKAGKPSLGLNFLRECGWIVHFPELADLINCPQNPKHHPEGDVWIHTGMVLDNAAQLRSQVPEKWRLAYMYGALLHDVGKPCTTVLPECTAYGHDSKGMPIARAFMERLTNDKDLIEKVVTIVGLHMRAGQLTAADAGINAWKRLHNKCRLDILGWMSKADSAGRTGRSLQDKHLPSEKCFELFKSLGDKKIPMLVTGKDLIQRGWKPSPAFGVELKRLYEMQLDGMSREELLQQITNDV